MASRFNYGLAAPRGGLAAVPPATLAENGVTSATSSMLSTATPRIAPPEFKPFEYSAGAINYPTYMKNLGEKQAQDSFQKNVRYTTQLGSAGQGFQQALDRRNTERLGYMGAAGKAQMDVEGQMQTADQQYKALLAQLYGLNIQQRGQEFDYLSSLNKSSSGGGGGVGSFRMGGGSSSGGTNAGGGYVGIGGRTSSSIAGGNALPDSNFGQGSWSGTSYSTNLF